MQVIYFPETFRRQLYNHAKQWCDLGGKAHCGMSCYRSYRPPHPERHEGDVAPAPAAASSYHISPAMNGTCISIHRARRSSHHPHHFGILAHIRGVYEPRSSLAEHIRTRSADAAARRRVLMRVPRPIWMRKARRDSGQCAVVVINEHLIF